MGNCKTEPVEFAGLSAPQAHKTAQFGLVATTVNPNCLRNLQAFLQNTDAHIVCGQEVRLLAEAIPDATRWATNNGWKSLFLGAAPAVMVELCTQEVLQSLPAPGWGLLCCKGALEVVLSSRTDHWQALCRCPWLSPLLSIPHTCKQGER